MRETRMLFAADGLGRLPELLVPGASLVLITGQRAAEECGLLARVAELVRGQAAVLATFAVPSHPSWDDYRRVEEAARQCGARGVVALGGGSALDVAKYAASAESAGLDLVAVPTLFGSGAEVTPFATVWNRDAARKESVAVRPCARLLVDPLLARTAPAGVRGTAALDALAHGADVLWQTETCGRVRAQAAAAMRLVGRWLPGAVAGETAALCRIAAASIVGGLAIASAGSGPSHALSYPLQLRFGLPHGLGCALALRWLLRAFPERAPVALLASLGAADAEAGAEVMARLIERAGWAAHPQAHGITPDAFASIAAEADPERLRRAGIRIAPDRLAKLLREAA
jgi:alcohol dehydrogenase